MDDSHSTVTALRRMWREALSNHRPLLYAFLVVLIPSSITLPLGLSNLGQLRASLSTPWGVVTAIFVHGDFGHYLGNVAWLALLVLLFAVLSRMFDGQERRRRASLFAWTVLVAAIVANSVFIWRFPASEGAYGASGAVYAAIGVVVMFASFNAVHSAATLWRERARGEHRRRAAEVTVLNLTAFFLLFLWIVIFPEGFLGVGEGSNVLGHGVAFFAALPAPIAYKFFWTSSNHGMANEESRPIRRT